MSLSFSKSFRQTADGTIWGFLAEALVLPTGLITAGYLTRHLGPEGYGLFTLAATLIGWVTFSTTSLFSRTTIKFISEANDWRHDRGQTLNALSENIFSTASQQLISYLYDYYNLNLSRTRLFISNNLAVPTRQFRTVGGFDTSFPLAAGEGREFSDRWLHHRYQATYAPEAIVYHAHALTLLSYCRQHFNYAGGFPLS